MDIFIPSTSASSRSKSLTLSVVRYNNDHVFYPKLMLTGSRLSRPHCILAHVFWDSVLSLTGPACYEKICSPSATVFFCFVSNAVATNRLEPATGFCCCCESASRHQSFSSAHVSSVNHRSFVAVLDWISSPYGVGKPAAISLHGVR